MEKEEHLEYVRKNIEDKPKLPGNYNIEIDGVLTFLPMFADFDGEKWLNIRSKLTLAGGDMSKIFYYEKNYMSRRARLSESFTKGAQTLDEATESARLMAESLEKQGLLLKAPKK